MTRKKIGVGLQESFAEVNATVNDNTAESSPRGGTRNRKGRSGNGNGNGGSNGGNGNGATGTSGGNGNGGQTHTQAHQLTDDVKNALSRIAASTIAHEDAQAPAEPIAIELPEAPAASAAEPEQPTSSRRRRGSRRASSGTAQATGDVQTITVADTPVPEQAHAPEQERPKQEQPEQEQPKQTRAARAKEAVIEIAAEHGVEAERAAEAPSVSTSRRVSTSSPVAPSDAPVAILDIPVAAPRREPRRVSSEAAESILDSVLQALPEPKQPGQGRSRSRRVSSGSISAPAAQTDGASSETDGPVILGS
jgi:ribonuclease E